MFSHFYQIKYMEKQKVYIETTIPSSYYDIRENSKAIARKEWTRHCWDSTINMYQFVTSDAVIDELKQGDYPTKNDTLRLMNGLYILDFDDSIEEIVEVYIKHFVMPSNPLGDALHLAIASVHKCEFLLTWNCQHLANANKFDHIRRVNTMLGLYCPYLITPLELIELEDL